MEDDVTATRRLESKTDFLLAMHAAGRDDNARRGVMRSYLLAQMGGADIDTVKMYTLEGIAWEYCMRQARSLHEGFFSFTEILHSAYQKGLADGTAAANGVEVWRDPEFDKATPEDRKESLFHAMHMVQDELEQRRKAWKSGDPSIEDLEAHTLYRYVRSMMGGADLTDAQLSEMRILCLSLYDRPHTKDPYKHFFAFAEALHSTYQKGFADGQIEVQSQLSQDLNYLKNAEMLMEDDYNMIDGIINNGPKNAAAEKGSVLEKLNVRKAAADRTDNLCQQKVQKHIEQEL